MIRITSIIRGVFKKKEPFVMGVSNDGKNNYSMIVSDGGRVWLEGINPDDKIVTPSGKRKRRFGQYGCRK